MRVFQDRQRRYRPVGSDREESVDVELVCASNLPVAELRNPKKNRVKTARAPSG